MQSIQESMPLYRQRQCEVSEKIAELFAVTEQTASDERAMDALVSGFLSDFSGGGEVSTDLSLSEITDDFRASRIPVEPLDVESYMEYLTSRVIQHTVRTSSPRFVGHMASGIPYFMRSLARLMVGVNQNVVKTETSKALTPFERQALAMIHRLVYGFSDHFYDRHIQHGESTLGIMTSGGTLANITALWCLRNRILAPRAEFGGVEAEGLAAALSFYGFNGATIIGSRQMHYSFDKAADVLGVGTRNLIRIATDSNFRIDLDELCRAIKSCQDSGKLIIAIVGIAGSTDCGAIDPLPEVAEIARNAGIHFHVDAAWAGPVLFSADHWSKLAGIETADSVTIDGHKQLYLPMGIGMVVFRDPAVADSIEKQARYIVRKGSADLGRRALEGSRPSLAMFLHAALHIIGCKGYELLINEGIRKTQYMAEAIRLRPEFELLCEPQINILLYRYIPGPWREKLAAGQISAIDNLALNRFNRSLQKAQRGAGCSFVSRTTIDDARYGQEQAIVALRAVIANPMTSTQDIDAVLDEQIKIADTLPVIA